MPLLSEVLLPLGVTVIATVEDGSERLLLIAKEKYKDKGFPPPPDHCYALAAHENDPFLNEREADAIRRHFRPPDSGNIITLGLSS